jgi:hypothetical protein
MFHKTIMKLYNISNGVSADGTPVSPNVQYLAAGKLADVLAPPIEQKVDIKIGQSDEAKHSQEKLYGEMKKLAENQQKLLEAGHSIEEVQRLNLVIDVEEDDGEAEWAELNDEGKIDG